MATATGERKHATPRTEASKPDRLSKIALFLSVLATSISVLTSVTTWPWIGSVEVKPLSGLAVVRGFDGFPSDHLVLPLDWSNTEGGPVLIHDLHLEVNANAVATMFLLAGEVPTIGEQFLVTKSGQEHPDMYQYRGSLIVEAQSKSTRNLVFHIEQWSDPAVNTNPFRFHPDQRATATLCYRIDSPRFLPFADDRPCIPLQLPLYPAIEKLDEDRPWDFFYINAS